MDYSHLKPFLDQKVMEYNTPGFIPNDPVSIPHRFSRKQDIEITGMWTAILSWGLRATIIRKCTELFEMMWNSPYEFIVNHSDEDLKQLQSFKHRTFNATDTLYFISFLREYYSANESLEDLFLADSMEDGLKRFHREFFRLPYAPNRTKKHIATPERNSACKRLNMFLRWMVRRDNAGVDFGLWDRIDPAALICPCDLHVDRVARKLGLIKRKQTDWHTAMELTDNLRILDARDPVKYDFALFGLGIEEKF